MNKKDKSIRVFYDKNHYNDWLFIYLPMADRGGLLKGPVNPGMPMGNLNAPIIRYQAAISQGRDSRRIGQPTAEFSSDSYCNPRRRCHPTSRTSHSRELPSKRKTPHRKRGLTQTENTPTQKLKH